MACVHDFRGPLDTLPKLFTAKMNELLAAYNVYEHIFIDGSKGVAAGTAAVSYSGHDVVIKRLPDNA
jgi:hypothetical protein